MNVEITDAEKSWPDIHIGLTDSDIGHLIDHLQALLQHRGHFHFRRDDFNAPSGIADIQIYWTDHAPANMHVE